MLITFVVMAVNWLNKMWQHFSEWLCLFWPKVALLILAWSVAKRCHVVERMSMPQPINCLDACCKSDNVLRIQFQSVFASLIKTWTKSLHPRKVDTMLPCCTYTYCQRDACERRGACNTYSNKIKRKSQPITKITPTPRGKGKEKQGKKQSQRRQRPRWKLVKERERDR